MKKIISITIIIIFISFAGCTGWEVIEVSNNQIPNAKPIESTDGDGNCAVNGDCPSGYYCLNNYCGECTGICVKVDNYKGWDSPYNCLQSWSVIDWNDVCPENELYSGLCTGTGPNCAPYPNQD